MIQLGICGTFDVQNYGDLLFPLIAEVELSRRLGPITLQKFSYFEKAPPDWPYRVTSLARLPKIAGELAGMIIGGGHLIRFDKHVAPGYHPPTPDIHHPTGYWLSPALICLHHDCPVAWGAPGALGAITAGSLEEVPAWAQPLMHLAIRLSSYVAVRDDHAQAKLAPFAGGQDIAVVPDMCFGIACILDGERPSAALSELLRSLNVTGPYIVVQATSGLEAFARLVAKHPARFAGYQIIALPVGPDVGDDAARLGNDFPNLVKVPDYPHPRLIAELIGGAAGVIGISLHLAITAIALGVPVFRPASEFDGKYAMLSRHTNVHPFAADEEIDPAWFEAKLAQHGLGAEMAEISAKLDRHWDRVAACFSADRETPDHRGAILWQQLSGLLESKSILDDAAMAMRDQQIGHLNATLVERDQQIGGQNGVIEQCNEQISHLSATLAERDQQIDGQNNVITQRDEQISGQNNVITQRDEQISHLNATLAERDQQIAAAKASYDRSGAEVMARNEVIRRLRNSTSWKLTAPVRWVGRRLRGSGGSRSRILRLERIEQEPLATVPYQWAFVNGLFSRRAGQSLARTYPRDNFKTVKGYDHEKGYEYEARALIHMNANSPSFPEGLSDAWRMLAEDLLSPAYRAAMTRLTGRDLSGVPMEAYVCHYGPGAYLGPHLDLKDKIVTHVFYFNASWEKENGGCLSILRSKDMSDKFAEVTPIVGNSSVVIRSENSWHSVSQVMNGCRTSRRSMNVIFYRPDAMSTMWPPGDDTALHRYEPPQEPAG